MASGYRRISLMLAGKEIEAYEKPNRPKYCKEMK